MRIAILNPGAVYGGVEKWVLRAAECLARRGQEVTVLGQPGGDTDQRCREEGIPFSPVRLRRGILRPGVMGLSRALREVSPDVLIVCNDRATRLAVIALRLPAPGATRGRRPPPLIY